MVRQNVCGLICTKIIPIIVSVDRFVDPSYLRLPGEDRERVCDFMQDVGKHSRILHVV